jgi:hypothetical protein
MIEQNMHIQSNQVRRFLSTTVLPKLKVVRLRSACVKKST